MAEIPVVLITGASSGIGRALALVYAQQGQHLLLVGRDEMALKATVAECQKQGIDVYVFCQDFEAGGAIERLSEFVRDNGYQVDVLINNAGLGYYGEFAEMSFERLESLLEVNIHALVKLTRCILSDMKSRKKGQIINIASVYAYAAIPYQSLYAASKAFVKSFSLGLAAELKESGITVSCVCPGSTQTQFHTRMGKSVQRSPFTLSAQAVAEFIYKKARKCPLIIIPAWYNRIFVFFLQWVPLNCLPRLINFFIYKLRRI